MIRSDDELLALHGLRLLGFAAPSRVADLVGLPVELVEAHLEAGALVGWTVGRDRPEAGPARRGWSLTGEGRRRVDEMLAEELDSTGARATVDACYRQFLALNRDLLDVCTRWQVKDLSARLLNDHSDPGYDAQVLDDLAGIDERVQPICAELGRCLARFARYGPRLGFALGRLRSGEADWLDKPLIASYHTVWFELHEDLLSTLGRDRASERGVDSPVPVP